MEDFHFKKQNSQMYARLTDHNLLMQSIWTTRGGVEQVQRLQ